MTASPGGEVTLEATIKKIGQLCLNMNSQIAMPIKHRDELFKYVNIPKLDVIYADFNVCDFSAFFYLILKNSLRKSNFSKFLKIMSINY